VAELVANLDSRHTKQRISGDDSLESFTSVIPPALVTADEESIANVRITGELTTPHGRPSNKISMVDCNACPL
jgi:hypothetical protein